MIYLYPDSLFDSCNQIIDWFQAFITLDHHGMCMCILKHFLNFLNKILHGFVLPCENFHYTL